MNQKQQLSALFAKYLSQSITPAEEQLFFSLMHADSNNLIREIIEEWMVSEPGDTGYRVEDWDSMIRSILHHPPKSGNLQRMGWRKWIAAASVIFILGVAGWFYVHSRQHIADENNVGIRQDVQAPATTRATIVLAGGKRVTLDSVAAGTLAKQVGITVSKNTNGDIVYNGAGAKETLVTYNTLINPRGSRTVSLTLSDGTRVWLNSESSIKYPVAFSGKERIVEMTGEAYFEVAHLQNNKPFKVRKGGTEVAVLGTHFNVNAYDDENTISVTLLEGAVKVFNEKGDVTLAPGEQANATSDAAFTVNRSPDIDAVMAWKNGYFTFKGATTEMIMKQIARWYDMEVSYEGNVRSEEFAGTVPRTSNLSEVLQIMELTKTVRFSIDHKMITVRPWK